MKKHTIFKTVLAAGMLMMAGCSSATTTSSATSEKQSLTVQFVPTNNDGSMEAKVKPFEEYLSKKLDCDVTVTMATDYSTIVEAMASGQVDIGIMPPAAYVQARSQGAAKAILSSSLGDYDENEQPIPDTAVSTFKGEVVVKADSNLNDLADLKGKTIATLSANSASGYIYPVAEMKDLGINPTKDCTLITVNDIPSELTAVLNGQADAAFVFEGARYVFASKFTDSDLFKDLKVLYLTKGDIPNDAIAVLPSMSSELQDKVKEVFLNMPNDEEGKEAMAMWNHTAYTEADEKAYDTIESYIEKAAE